MWPQTVRKADLKIESFRGSGAGGQNRNRRNTAVRITHIPTGISTIAQDQRTYNRNLQIAFKRLTDRLVPLMKAACKAPKIDMNSDVIRTYREPDKKVIDQRTPNTVWAYDEIVHKNGIDALIKYLVGKR